MVRVVLNKKSSSSSSPAAMLIVACLGMMLAVILYVNFGMEEAAALEAPVQRAALQQASPPVLRTTADTAVAAAVVTAVVTGDSNKDDGAKSNDKHDDCCSLAKRESNSFFRDISDADWTIKKQIYQSMQPNNSMKNLSRQKRKADPTDFWNNNYEPEFTCPMQRRLGIPVGDGGKWVCDPHRIGNDDAACLVYSVGSNGNAVFEKAMHEILAPRCQKDLQIHTFDLKGWNKRNGKFSDRVREAGGVFHEWGLTVDEMNFEQDEYFIPKVYRTLQFKTFGKTFEELGHKNRVIDVLKIDCEGCEWQSVQGWLRDWKANGVVVRQLLLELHDAPIPQAPEFFQTLKEAGYVIFHKEVTGSCAEYAFVLVEPSFLSYSGSQ